MKFVNRHLARAKLLALLGLAVLMTGCASIYVDNGTREVPQAEFRKPAEAKPVQVFFEFQTKGAANARGTELLRARVVDQIKASGLFASVVDTASPQAGLLNIVVNNVSLTDDAAAKGFMTGLTLGLAGSQVTDGYICTVRYRAPGSTEPIVKEARHALHTTLGAGAAPKNATKADSIDQAITTVMRQIVSNVLNDLSKDPNFK